MRFENVCIEAIAHLLPSNVIRSSDMEAQFADTLKRLGMPPGQVEKLSGVKERRWWDPGTQPSTPAAMAAERVLEQSGVDRHDIDILINTSVSKDYLEPATAAMVAGKLGLSHNVAFFDVGNACVGFLNGLHLAATLVESGQARRVLVVDAEVVRNGVEATLQRLASPNATIDTFRDNFATLTLGGAAAACIVSHKDVSTTNHRLHGAVLRTAPERNTLCLANHTEMRSDAHGLLVYGVGLAVETWPHAAAEMGWNHPDAIDQFVCHQVSVAHFTHSFQHLEQPLEKAILTLPHLGNCGPASTPVTLALGVASGRIQEGDEVCLFAVGSGLSCCIMGVHW